MTEDFRLAVWTLLARPPLIGSAACVCVVQKLNYPVNKRTPIILDRISMWQVSRVEMLT